MGNEDGTVNVDNNGAKEICTGDISEAVGTATVKDRPTCDPDVQFPGAPIEAPYQIRHPDYDNYIDVISCIPVLNALGQSDIWNLSRTPKLPTDTLESILQKLEDAGFDYGDIQMQEQESDCNYNVGIEHCVD